MRTGWYISGAGHVSLLLFLLVGGLFSRDRIPEVTVSEVSIISEAEFAALTLPASAPETQTDAPNVEAPPEDATPETPAEDTAPAITEPAPVEVPEPPAAADITRPEPLPQTAVVDEAPEIDLPETDIDGSSLERDVIAAPAPRVAPTPSIAPPPLAEVAPDRIEDTAPDPDTPAEVQPEPDAPAAPEQASDRIVTEAEEQRQTAPASSMRPRSRPVQPVQPVRQAETATPEPQKPRQTDTSSAVAAALAQPTPAPAAPQAAYTGPPLTGGEKDALRVSVQQCWNVGSLSTEALGTTVVVAVEMEQSGVPLTDTIRLVSSSGGSSAAAQQAFEAARRAIIRCGARGFPLPVEKFGEWRDIEMTFNPEGMQFR